MIYNGTRYHKWSVPDSSAGMRGDLIVSGHTPGVFSGLSELEAGDRVYVYKDGLRIYTVTEILLIDANDAATYTQLESQSGRLMLVTCEGSLRRIVLAAEARWKR